MEVTRKKIFLYWLLVGVTFSILSASISMLFWHFTYEPEPNVKVLINDMIGMFTIMPLGWLIYLLTPAGWLSVLGLVLGLYTKSLKPLILSALGSILFGIYWPEHFVAIMGI